MLETRKKRALQKAQLRAFLEDVVSDKQHQCTRREFSYAYCLGSAGQERLLTEVDKPIGMTVQYELLEGAGYAKRRGSLCYKGVSVVLLQVVLI